MEPKKKKVRNSPFSLVENKNGFEDNKNNNNTLSMIRRGASSRGCAYGVLFRSFLRLGTRDGRRAMSVHDSQGGCARGMPGFTYLCCTFRLRLAPDVHAKYFQLSSRGFVRNAQRTHHKPLDLRPKACPLRLTREIPQYTAASQGLLTWCKM